MTDLTPLHAVTRSSLTGDLFLEPEIDGEWMVCDDEELYTEVTALIEDWAHKDELGYEFYTRPVCE